MHHEGLVELIEVEVGARAELDVNHGAHREGREHLMCRLDGEDGGTIGHVVGDAHGEAALVDLMELGVGVPCLIEVDARNGLCEFSDDFVDVVAEPVVGGVGDDRVGGVLVRDAGGEWALVDDAADELGRKPLEGDEADHAVAVARGLHVDGARAGNGEGVADGFVAVGVGEDDVVLCDNAVPDDLIGGRRSSENVEGPVGSEDAGGVALGFAGRSEVIEPGAERRSGDAEVRTHDVFAEEFVKLHADGVLEIGDAAHVAGGVPGVGALVVIFFELAEVRGKELLVVALDGEVDAVGDEGGGVSEEVDVLVDLLDDFEGKFADKSTVGDEEDGDFFVAATDGAKDCQCRSFGELVLAFEVPVQQDCAVRWVGGDQGQTVLWGGCSNDLVAFFANCVD